MLYQQLDDQSKTAVYPVVLAPLDDKLKGKMLEIHITKNIQNILSIHIYFIQNFP
jgi:hypothetical protein